MHHDLAHMDLALFTPVTIECVVNPPKGSGLLRGDNRSSERPQDQTTMMGRTCDDVDSASITLLHRLHSGWAPANQVHMTDWHIITLKAENDLIRHPQSYRWGAQEGLHCCSCQFTAQGVKPGHCRFYNHWCRRGNHKSFPRMAYMPQGDRPSSLKAPDEAIIR